MALLALLQASHQQYFFKRLGSRRVPREHPFHLGGLQVNEGVLGPAAALLETIRSTNSGYSKELDNMKVGSRRNGFVSLLLACLSACSYSPQFSCEKKLHDEVASADGRLKAAILDVQCGATTQDASWVVVSYAREDFDEERDKVAIFEGAVNDLTWQGNQLHVLYGTAKPFLMNKEAKGAQVIYRER
jgi:hypothetical protein